MNERNVWTGKQTLAWCLWFSFLFCWIGFSMGQHRAKYWTDEYWIARWQAEHLQDCRGR